MLQNLKRLATLALSYLPSKLPNTPKSIEDWLQAVLTLSGYPNNPSFKSALLTQVMHLQDQRCTHMSKQYFVKSLAAAVIRQQVFAAIEDIRDAAKEARGKEAQETGNPVSSSPKTPLVQ